MSGPAFDSTLPLCVLPECRNGPDPHPFGSSCLEDDDSKLNISPTMEKILDGIDNEHLRRSAKEFYAYEDRCLASSTEDEPTKDNVLSSFETPDVSKSGQPRRTRRDANQAICDFFNHWTLPKNQEKLFSFPMVVIDYILDDPDLISYHGMYGLARLKMDLYELSLRRELMIDFVSSRNVQYFQSFDVVLFGVGVALKSNNTRDLDILKVEFESKVSYLSDAVKAMEDHLNTIGASHEALRDSINIVSEVSNQLKAEIKSLDLSKEKDPHNTPSYTMSKALKSNSNINSKPSGIIVKMDHISIVLTESHMVDADQTKLANKMLTGSEFLVIKGLSNLKSEVTLRALGLRWNDLHSHVLNCGTKEEMDVAKAIAYFVKGRPSLPPKIEI